MSQETVTKGRSDRNPVKVDLVKTLAKELESSPIIGVVNMENLPAKQLQNMRETLRENVHLVMAKKRLIRLALKDAKKDVLIEHLKGMPALLFTTENPFTLFKALKKNKSKAPIKGGQIAPNDITVPAGPTDFAPGPIIGELGSFGIKSGVENGKIAIKADAVVAKEGDEVSQGLAALLTRMNIEPMEIGLDLVAVYEHGDILTKDVLDIDEEKYYQEVQTAGASAFNLAMFVGYPTSDTIGPLLSKAVGEARALALSQDILADEVVPDLLSKAHAQANALQTITSGEQPAAPAAPAQAETTPEAPEKSVEKPEEEKKEEATAGLGALFG